MSLTETSINHMDIDNINNLLNGGKYIPKIKKDKLLERKNLLEGKSKKHIVKHFNNNIDDFPILSKKIDTNKIENNNVWTTKKSDKIYDKKNVPETIKKNILKTEKNITNNLELSNKSNDDKYDNEYDDEYDNEYYNEYDDY